MWQISRLIGSITPTTTPDEFNTACQKIPGYTLEQQGIEGWNALSMSALCGNIKLVEYILSQNNYNLVNSINQYGWTPLYAAANCKDSSKAIKVALQLIQAGANVNAKTSHYYCTHLNGTHPIGSTPLWAAATQTRHSKLVKLFLKHHATISLVPYLKLEAKVLITYARHQLKTERKIKYLLSFGATKDSHSCLRKLPLDLIKVIFKYVIADMED